MVQALTEHLSCTRTYSCNVHLVLLQRTTVHNLCIHPLGSHDSCRIYDYTRKCYEQEASKENNGGYSNRHTFRDNFCSDFIHSHSIYHFLESNSLTTISVF